MKIAQGLTAYSAHSKLESSSAPKALSVPHLINDEKVLGVSDQSTANVGRVNLANTNSSQSVQPSTTVTISDQARQAFAHHL